MLVNINLNMRDLITVHMIVKNEQQWVWYALMSVLNHIDAFVIYDTGSTDKTIEIISLFKKRYKDEKSIIFRKFTNISPLEITKLRNEQISETKSKWFMLLDGDEVWNQDVLSNMLEKIKFVKESLHAMGLRALVPLGDIFHVQDESAGKYRIGNIYGHLNIRFYKISRSYRWVGTYPLEAYTDREGIAIQNKKNEILLSNDHYWHLTHLQRSTRDSHLKLKNEFGNYHSENLPSVFFGVRPDLVPSPWVHFNAKNYLLASILTPLYKSKRSIAKQRYVPEK